MNIKIHKFKNIYGIKNLTKTEELKDNLILYAPNGGTKTSLALGFKSISDGILPNDRIFGRKAEYSFEIDGKTYDNNNITKINNIVVYSYENYIKLNIDNNKEKLSMLAVSEELKNKYNNIYNHVENNINDLIIEISKELGNNKKSEENVLIVYNELTTIFNVNSWKEIIKKLSEQNWEKLIETNNNYFDIINENTISIISDKNFIQEIEDLNKIIASKVITNLFSGEFGSMEAEKLLKTLDSTHYFDAKHGLIINGLSKPIYTIDDYKTLLEQECMKLYGSADIKERIENLMTSLQKNKATKRLRDILSDKKLLLQLGDLNNFKIKIILFKLKSFRERIYNLNKLICDNEEKLLEFKKEVMKQKNDWNNIVELFNNRFDVPFVIEISNKFNTMTGISLPNFIFKFKESTGNEKEVQESILKEVLSTGEKRALTILYFLFDVKYSIKFNSSTFIILDDIVDSFDYKNKYAMLEYLDNLTTTNNVISWVLTHNFDFFTTCKSRIKLFQRKFIKNDSTCEIINTFDGNITVGGLEMFSDWKNDLKTNGNKKKLISLIPVARNIIELKYGNISQEYNLLSDLLHYRYNTANILIKDLKPIFNDVFNLNINLSDNDKVVDILDNEVKILNGTNLSNNIHLENKLIYSIAIRHLSEKIFNIYNPSLLQSDFSIGKEYETVKNYFNDDENRIFNRVIISIPEFIHINSFMYEPLVDIDTKFLKQLYLDVSRIYEMHKNNKNEVNNSIALGEF